MIKRIFISMVLLFLVDSAVMAEEALPLSAEQITKLQHFFPHTFAPNFIAQPSEHLIWNQTPIEVVLPVGKERMVSFPTSVQFGYDNRLLTDDNLRIQNNGGTLYFLAKSAFAPQRVQVRLSDSGKIILLDLSAQQEASDTALTIVIPAALNTASITNTDSDDINSSKKMASMTSSVTALSLTRFAAQQLYAPKRLLTQPDNIFRTPMHTRKTVPLFQDGSVLAMPLASWRGADLFVTAILLRNQEPQNLSLDPRTLCGHWQAATFFPQSQLTPSGTRTDTTTLLLISKRPFADSLRACTTGF